MDKENYTFGLNLNLPKKKTHLFLLIIGLLFIQFLSFWLYDTWTKDEACKDKYEGLDLKLNKIYAHQKITRNDIWISNDGTNCKFSGWIWNELENRKVSYYISHMSSFGYDKGGEN